MTMEPEEFAGMIMAMLSTDENTRNESNERQIDMLEKEPAQFLNMLIQFTFSSKEIAHIRLAITLMYSFCAHRKLPQNEELYTIFCNGFVEKSLGILAFPAIDENTKMLVSHILAEVAISLYSLHPENSQIQEFLMCSVAQEGNVAPFILCSISEILFSSTDFCNFNPEQLFQLISLEICPFLRVKLYFAIALHSPLEQEELHSIFGNVISLIDASGEIAKCFNVISRFAEVKSRFFWAHIEQFMQYVCSNILSGDDNTKREGIYILQSMAENDREMCFVSAQYFQPTYDVLIRLMSQITEGSSYDIDPNDCEPCTIARLAFHAISKKINSVEAMSFLISWKDGIINRLQEPDLLYGMLIAISEMSSVSLLKLYLVEKNELWNSIIRVLTLEGVTPRIIYASYAALSKIAKTRLCNFQRETAVPLLQIALSNAIGIDMNEVSMSCIRFLQLYAENWLDDSFLEYFTPFFTAIATQISSTQCEEKLIMLAELQVASLNTFCRISETLCDQSTFAYVLSYLIKIVNEASSLDYKARAVVCFSKLLLQAGADSVQEISDNISTFFEYSIMLIKTEGVNPQTINIVSKAQKTMMAFLGANINKFEEQIVIDCLSVLRELPQVEEFDIFDQFLSPMYYCAPNSKPGLRSCFNKTIIEMYIKALGKIKLLAIILEQDFSKYLQNIIPILVQILSQEEFIEPLRIKALVCMTCIVLSQSDNPQVYIESLQIAIDAFVKQISAPYSANSFYVILNEFTILVISVMQQSGLPPEISDAMKKAIMPLITVIKCVKDSLEDMILETDSCGAECGTCIDFAIEKLVFFTKTIWKILPTETIGYFDRELLPGIIKNISENVCTRFELQFFFAYIKMVKSEEVFLRFKEMIYQYIKVPNEFSCKIEAIEAKESPIIEQYNNILNALIDGLICVFKNNILSAELAKEIFEIVLTLINAPFMHKPLLGIAEDNIKILLVFIVLRYRLLEGEELCNFIQDYTFIHNANKYNHVMASSIRYIITNLYEQFFYEESEKEVLLYDLFDSFFELFSGGLMDEMKIQEEKQQFMEAIEKNPELKMFLNEYH